MIDRLVGPFSPGPEPQAHGKQWQLGTRTRGLTGSGLDKECHIIQMNLHSPDPGVEKKR